MKVKVQVVTITDDGQETPRDIACIERHDLRACLRIPAMHTLARFRVPAQGGSITPIPCKSAQRIFA